MNKILMARSRAGWRHVGIQRLMLGLLLLALAPLAARADQPWWKTNMELVGDLAVGNPVGLDVSGSRVYLKCSWQKPIDYVVVADVGNPQNPRLVGTWDPPSPLQMVVALPNNSVAGVYASDQRVLHIYELSDPNAPKESTTIDFSPHIFNLAIAGNLIAVTSQPSSGDSALMDLTLLDLSDPANPKTASRQHLARNTSYSSYNRGAVQISGSRLFVDVGNLVYAFDVTDPAAAKQLAKFSITGGTCVLLRAEGNYLYDGYYNNNGWGIKVYDWTQPDNQNYLGSFQVNYYPRLTEDSFFDVAGMQGFVTDGLMVDAMDATALSTSDFMRGNYRMPTQPTAVKALGNYVYVALADRGLSILRYTGENAAVKANVQTAWPRGEQVVMSWITNVAKAGTAVRFELWRAGAKVQDLGVGWNPNGAAQQPVTVPPNLAPGNDYLVRVVSFWDPQLWTEVGPIYIN